MGSESFSRNNPRLDEPPKDKDQESDSSNTCTINRKHSMTSQPIITKSARETGVNSGESGSQESKSLIRNALQLQLNHQRTSSYIQKCMESKYFIRNAPKKLDLE